MALDAGQQQGIWAAGLGLMVLGFRWLIKTVFTNHKQIAVVTQRMDDLTKDVAAIKDNNAALIQTQQETNKLLTQIRDKET